MYGGDRISFHICPEIIKRMNGCEWDRLANCSCMSEQETYEGRCSPEVTVPEEPTDDRPSEDRGRDDPDRRSDGSTKLGIIGRSSEEVRQRPLRGNEGVELLGEQRALAAPIEVVVDGVFRE